jgi:hypothetical protein
MWPFSHRSKQKIGNSDNAGSTNKPVENPDLEAAFVRHGMERTEESAIAVGQALQAATYLVPVVSDKLVVSTGVRHQATIEAGSVIEFMVCENTGGERFLPAFTSWHEIRRWAGENVNAFALGSKEVWSLTLSNSNLYAGVVINPASNPWTLLPQNIRALVEEHA